MEGSPEHLQIANNPNGKRKTLKTMNCGSTTEKHRQVGILRSRLESLPWLCRELRATNGRNACTGCVFVIFVLFGRLNPTELGGRFQPPVKPLFIISMFFLFNAAPWRNEEQIDFFFISLFPSESSRKCSSMIDCTHSRI